MNQKELAELIRDPADHFKSPEDVLKDTRLSDDEKYHVLESWAEEEREKAVATEENMGGDDNNGDLLDRINRAITEGLGYSLHLDKSAPTKQGG